jgi:hypothetical protein
LINHRAALSLGREVDVFDTFFPEQVVVNHGRRDTYKDPRAFLLEFTRHTPRDLITLLNFVQREAAGKSILTAWDLDRAAKNYSVAYFVPEIRDELNGYFSPDEITQIVALLSALAEREFTFNQISNCAECMAGDPLDVSKVLVHLFECSALGNIEPVGGHTHFSFKYRNRNAVLDMSKKMMLHRGMWKALNLR